MNDAQTLNDFIGELRSRVGFWYFATPYTKYHLGIEEAFKEACRAAAFLKRRGAQLYCPIAETHPIAVYGEMDPLDGELWQSLYVELMDRACGLIVCKMQGWDESRGVAIEIEAFKEVGKPIVFLEWPQ